MILTIKIYKLLIESELHIDEFIFNIEKNISIDVNIQDRDLFIEFVQKQKSITIDIFFNYLRFELNINEFKGYPSK